ncbi:MAG: hypothetical protein ACPHN2_03470 [Sinimarinibacterium flocculans]|uniref:Outer membrane protein with beta-barrel domain n=1 Tax=Sinimarinibacterium flocculans TaxID=985250 RepID=A0A318EDC1_9GAMM|nr:hypothetical protein [Sinimarinibacterium flocculans]MEC9361582.1 hypothetical protein [Pseudomonadota bacterium]PXV69624.1 hypothetical protein C8D93_103198 [Sinimarinibacterium flocculans]
MKLKIAVAAGLLAVANTAMAEEMYFSARVGPTLGMYQQDATFVIADADTGDVIVEGQSDDSWETAYGAQVGASAAYGNFFGDIGIEFLAVDSDADLDRTDVLVSLGYLIGQHWSAFVGYRKGMQGDGFFDDDTFNESGFFLGAGIGGVEVGDFVVGSSLAYNFSEAKDFPFEGEEFDYEGISFKLSGSLKSMPQHSLQFRYQRFTGDSSDVQPVDVDGDGVPDGNLRLDVDLTESYMQLTYLYSF